MMWMFLLGLVAGVVAVVFVAMALAARDGSLFGDDMHDVLDDSDP